MGHLLSFSYRTFRDDHEAHKGFDKDLKEHFLTGRGNATSTSKTGQEEVIRIIGAYIRSKVTQPIQKENAFFSIIGDEVTDKYTNQEVLSVCLKVFRSKK